MNRKCLFSTVFFMIFLAVGVFSCKDTGSDQQEKSENTIHLFNGENLDGWYTYLKGIGKDKDPNNVFSVQDGMIRITGEDWGAIVTDEEYENYHLILEFKWGGGTHEPRADRARDCGVLLHSIGEDGAYSDTWMYSIECQIIEGGTGDFIVVGDRTDKFSITSPVASEKQGSSWVYQPGGQMETINGGRINWWGRSPEWKDTIGFRGDRDVEHPVGEWNKMECIAGGDSIIVKLNDVIVNKAFDVKPSKGRIQIQSEAAEIYFRRVDLIPM